MPIQVRLNIEKSTKIIFKILIQWKLIKKKKNEKAIMQT
jgi:hypothetical protein